ncbi:unnamed protein product [Amoebophrya sp. A120]|nr:unnamed protein product [Amoebophrya sp. A120]|eukprot:GSA120T00021718001.1
MATSSSSSSGLPGGAEGGSRYGKTLKNGVVVDCPDHAQEFHVYQDGQALYNAKLNQTSLSRNNNKYYIIQLLEHDLKRGSLFVLWTRWGRHGYEGQHANVIFSTVTHPRNLKEAALQAFTQKFYDKTANHFGKEPFTHVDGKYQYLPPGKNPAAPGSTKTSHQPSTLPESLQVLMELICDEDLLEQEIFDIGLDTARLDLGTVSEKVLEEAFAVLKRINTELHQLDGASQSKLSTLTSQFFQFIPHYTGFKKMENFIINTPQRLAEEVTNLRRLQEAVESYRVIAQRASSSAKLEITDHPHDVRYKKFKYRLRPLEPAHTIPTLVNYVTRNLHALRHRSFSLKLEQVFALENPTEDLDPCDLPNKQLLWYGGPLRQWARLLTQGLQLPTASPGLTGTDGKKTSDAWCEDLPLDWEELQGSLGGPALYLQDCLSYAAWRCDATENENRGLALLCEVSLGHVRTSTRPEPGLSKAAMWQEGMNSGLALGCEQAHQWVSFSPAMLEAYAAGVEPPPAPGPAEGEKDGPAPMDVDGGADAGVALDKVENQTVTNAKELPEEENIVFAVGDLQEAEMERETRFALNEYAVYDRTQVVPRFLCQFEFSFPPQGQE